MARSPGSKGDILSFNHQQDGSCVRRWGLGSQLAGSSRNLCPVSLHSLITHTVGKVPAFWIGPSTPIDRGDGQLWVEISVVLKKSNPLKCSPLLTGLFMHPFNKWLNTYLHRLWSNSIKTTIPKLNFVYWHARLTMFSIASETHVMQLLPTGSHAGSLSCTRAWLLPPAELCSQDLIVFVLKSHV